MSRALHHLIQHSKEVDEKEVSMGGVDITVSTAYGAYTSSLDMARRSLDVKWSPGALRQIYGILWNFGIRKGGSTISTCVYDIQGIFHWE